MRIPRGHLYGEPLRSRDITGFLLTETAYEGGINIPTHSHDVASFCFVRRGSYIESYGKHVRICSPRTLIFRPPGEEHKIHTDHFGRPGYCFNIEVAPQSLARLTEYAPVTTTSCDYRDGVMTALAIRIYREFQEHDEISSFMIECLTLELMGHLFRRGAAGIERTPPRWLLQVRDTLCDQFSTRINFRDVANSVGVHPSHLTRVFRQHYHCTMGDYIRKLRVEFACEELSKIKFSLVEIAFAAGFSDQAHFSRVFKDRTGLTPAEYRSVARSR